MDAVAEDVPWPARLVRDFINTVERQTDEESLSSPAELSQWLQQRGLKPSEVTLGTSDLVLAKTIREGLRSVLEMHAGRDADPSAIESLNRALADVPMVLAFAGAEAPKLGPAKPKASTAALAPLVAAINASQLDGTWERLKVCARDSCKWAFYDASRNRSGRWCSMAGCGNHFKMQRAYAVRKGRPVPDSPAHDTM